MAFSSGPPFLRLSWFRLVTLLFVVVISFLAVDVFLVQPRQRATGRALMWFMSSWDLQEIRRALEIHAEQNGGRLPDRLTSLSPAAITPEYLSHLVFIDPESKLKQDWLYYPRTSLPSLPAKTILAASPMAFPGKGGSPERIVMQVSGVSFVPETEFQKMIAEQSRQPHETF